MESIASKLKTKRESLNISLEQISEATRISVHHLKSLENGRYGDLPGGMYNRAILRAYCDAIGLDLENDESLQRYGDEIAPQQKEPVVDSSNQQHFSLNIKTHTAVIWSMAFLLCVGLFMNRHWLVSALSPYSSSEYDRPTEQPSASAKTVNADTTVNAATDAQTANVSDETTPAASRSGSNETAAVSQPLRLEIVGKEECWLSIDSDESGAVTKMLSPGDVEFFTAARTIFLIVGNAGGVSLRINDRAAKTLGQSGQVVRLTIDKDTLPSLIDPSAS